MKICAYVRMDTQTSHIQNGANAANSKSVTSMTWGHNSFGSIFIYVIHQKQW